MMFRHEKKIFNLFSLSASICVNLCPIIVFAFILFSSSVSFANDFTATHLGDYGNVTVMEVAGNYDAKFADGSGNHGPREEIAKEFYKTHKDEFDFLVIFSNFNFRMLDDKTIAFYTGVRNDIRGIGIDLFDNSSFYGSNGKLQGTIDMGNIANNATDPLDPGFEDTLNTLSHELLHRWAAKVKFKDAGGNISSALLGKDGSHWSFLFDSQGSLEYGNRWQDNGDGTFTSLSPQGDMKYYGPLDLYLMGMIDKSKVPPMLLIDNPDVDPNRLPEAGVTITGTPRYITIDDIIAAEGERIPSAADSQKSFKTAFIFVTKPGTFTGKELAGIENIRNGGLTRFSVLTDGQGLLKVALAPKETLPSNPGVILPPVVPRTLPADINEGVAWLMNNQLPDGSWSDLDQTLERDTAEVVQTLKSFGTALQNYSSGLTWLGGAEPGNMDYLSRKIEALAASGEDVTPLVDELVLRQNGDGGWGVNRYYRSNAGDTGLALRALAAAGHSDQTVVSKSIDYLKGVQSADSGWASGESGSNIQSTVNVLTAFNHYRNTYLLDDPISSGVDWLKGKQNADGGFGNSPSTVYDTALATMALRELDVPTDVTNLSLDYLRGQQSQDGSWHSSAYQTALAVSAVHKATIDPDLSIKPDNITFIPSTITSLPANVVINAEIRNLGQTDVPQAKVVLYEGSVDEANKVDEQVLAFPGQSTVALTFSVAVNDGDEHRYYISVDGDDIVAESNENNNIALKVLHPESTYDFEIAPADITVSQAVADAFQDVTITSSVTNRGTQNAYNVQLKYFIDEVAGPFDIATVIVDIPAGATVTNEYVWTTNRAGVDMPLTVEVDPFNSFAEISETNNRASTTLTVKAITKGQVSTYDKVKRR